MHHPNKNKPFQQGSPYGTPTMGPATVPSSIYRPPMPYAQAQQPSQPYNPSPTMQYPPVYGSYTAPAYYSQYYGMASPVPMPSYGPQTYTNMSQGYAAPYAYPTQSVGSYPQTFASGIHTLPAAEIQQGMAQMSFNPSAACYSGNSQQPVNSSSGSHHGNPLAPHTPSIGSFNGRGLSQSNTAARLVTLPIAQFPALKSAISELKAKCSPITSPIRKSIPLPPIPPPQEVPAPPPPPYQPHPLPSKPLIEAREQIQQQSKQGLKLALEKLAIKKKELVEWHGLRRSSQHEVTSASSEPDSPALKIQPAMAASTPRSNDNLGKALVQGNTMDTKNCMREGMKQSGASEMNLDSNKVVTIKLEDDAEPSISQADIPKPSVSSSAPAPTTESSVLGKRTRDDEAVNNLAKRWKEMIQHQRSLIDGIESYVENHGQIPLPPTADTFLDTSLMKFEVPHIQKSNSVELVNTSSGGPLPHSNNPDPPRKSTGLVSTSTTDILSSLDQAPSNAIKRSTRVGKILDHNHRQVLIVWPPVRDNLATSPTKQPALTSPEKAGSSSKVQRQFSPCKSREDSSEKNTFFSDQAGEIDAPSVAASSQESAPSSQPPTEPRWCLRYATPEEIKKLVRSIDNEKYQVRQEGSYEAPTVPEDCFAHPHWLPYRCFICNQTRNSSKEIKTHLRVRHSIIMVDKIQAWECFYPGCSKRFSSRSKGLKHALNDHWPDMALQYHDHEYGRVTSEDGWKIPRDED